MQELSDIQEIIFEQFNRAPFYPRQVFEQFNLNRQITGLVGARGIGKTTYLLKQALEAGAKQGEAMYVSADNIFFLENKLVDLVDQLYKGTKTRLLCIDEIHKYPNWNQELKNIADIYKDFRVLFTGSSAIDIIHSKYDLSRRVALYHLNGLSFREYLEFYLEVSLPRVSFNELLANHVDIVNQIDIPKILMYFNDYLQIGYYPFFKELDEQREKFDAVENAVQKTIYEDIGTLHQLKTSTLLTIERLYKYILNSQPGEMSAYKLASALNKDFDSISEYLKFLEQAGLIRFLFTQQSGKAQLRNPAKMYPDNPNLIYASYLPQLADSTIGKVRETFVISHLQNAGLKPHYNNVGDFVVDDVVLEVGGRNKTRKQIRDVDNAYILADGIVMGSGNKVPLYLVGLLY